LRAPLRWVSALPGVSLSAPGFEPTSGSLAAWPLGLPGFSAAATTDALLVGPTGGSARSLAATTMAPPASAIAAISLPAKSAIARVVLVLGS
jgi:hypothetical protein